MTQLREKAHLMTGSEIDRTLVHLAHEIIGKTENLAELILIGVRRRGVYLAQRLARKIADITGVQVATGSLDIQPYRDDVDGRGRENRARAQIDFPITDKDVLIVDDVLYTGRTCRAAMEAIFDHGRPRRVRLCALIDRGNRELPIEAAFVGKRIAAAPEEVIEVRLHEEDETEKVVVLQRAEARRT